MAFWLISNEEQTKIVKAYLVFCLANSGTIRTRYKQMLDTIFSFLLVNWAGKMNQVNCGEMLNKVQRLLKQIFWILFVRLLTTMYKIQTNVLFCLQITLIIQTKSKQKLLKWIFDIMFANFSGTSNEVPWQFVSDSLGLANLVNVHLWKNNLFSAV